MKKIVLLLVFALVVCTGCAGTEDALPTTESTNEATAPATTAPSETTPPTTEATEAPTTEPTTAPTEPEPTVAYDDNGYTPRALMYHLIMEEPYNYNTTLFVRPSVFEEQLQLMNDGGYIYLFGDEYGKTAEKSVILTFDDGYEDNYTTMFPILKKYNAKATVYLIGDLIGTPGYLTVDQIKEMSDSGYVKFGCHTMTHCYLGAQTAENVHAEIANCVALVEDITGKECDSIAYPNGSYTEAVTEIARQYISYAYNSSDRMPEGEEDAMHIPRIYVSRELSALQLFNRLG